MKTREELLTEVKRLEALLDIDESGLIVRLITVVALLWVLDTIPISPSGRLEQTCKELNERGSTDLLEGVMDNEKGE